MLADVATCVFGFDLTTIGFDMFNIQYYSSNLRTIGVFVNHSSSGNEHLGLGSNNLNSNVCVGVRVRACVCVRE